MATLALRVCGSCKHMHNDTCYRYPPRVFVFPHEISGHVQVEQARPNVTTDERACGEYVERRTGGAI